MKPKTTPTNQFDLFRSHFKQILNLDHELCRLGSNKAFAALRVDGKWIGASQRAPSFPCVAWEYPVKDQDSNNTFYFPVTDAMRGEKVEIVVLGLSGGTTRFKPSAWITTHQAPFESIMLRLEE